MNKRVVGGTVAAVGIIFAIFLFFFCSVRIPAGYVGVVYNMNGGIEGVPLPQGWHWVAPTKHVTTYSIGIEQSYLTADKKGDSKEDESFSVPTSDGKTVTVDLEFSFCFDADVVSATFTRFKGQSGESVKNTFIKPKMMAWTQDVTARYPVTDIFGDKRSVINNELDKYLKAKFKPYGIIIDTVNFTNIAVDADTDAAIQRKVNAQQELELAQITAQTDKINANKDKEVAQIAAETALIEANNAAEVARIQADSEAYANSVVSASITENLLEMRKIEQWDGHESEVTNGGSVIVMRGQKAGPAE